MYSTDDKIGCLLFFTTHNVYVLYDMLSLQITRKWSTFNFYILSSIPRVIHILKELAKNTAGLHETGNGLMFYSWVTGLGIRDIQYMYMHVHIPTIS